MSLLQSFKVSSLYLYCEVSKFQAYISTARFQGFKPISLLQGFKVSSLYLCCEVSRFQAYISTAADGSAAAWAGASAKKQTRKQLGGSIAEHADRKTNNGHRSQSLSAE